MDTIELPPMDITPDEKKPRKAFTDVQNLMNRQKEKYNIRTVEGLNDEQLAEYDKDPAAYEERELREQSRDIQSVSYDDVAEATFAEEENEYDKVAKDLYGSNRAVIDNSLDNAIKKNPKQTAEVLKLSDELKVSPDFVERNLDEVRAISKKNKIDVGDLQANYPAMAKYLSNPDNAALSIEDIEHLKRIELAAREIGPNSLRRSAPLQLWDALASGKKVDEDLEWMAKTTAGLSKAGLRITKGITQLPALAEAMAIYPINSYLEDIDPALAGTVKPTRALIENPITRFLDKRIGALSTPESERSVIDLIQEGKIADAMETTWYQATEQIPQVGLMVLMSAKYGTQALASLAGISAVEGYDEGIREGKSPKDATRQALGYGIFEYAGERVTMGLLNSTRNRIIKEISKDATAKERIKNGLTTWFKEVSKDAVEEGAAEGFTTLGQNFTDYMTGDKAAMDNAVKDVINSAIIGGVVGGGIGAVSATSGALDRGDYPDDPTAALDQATNEAANAYQSQKEIDKLKEIGEVMQEMGPTLDRPGAIEELVNKVTEGDEDAGSVYFQKDDWDSFWNKKGKDGDFLAQTISEEVQREYEEAKEHGGQIEVPLGKFVERFGNTQEYQELLEIVKTRADGYKSAEAKERIANLNKLMNELDKEANAEAEEDTDKRTPLAKTRAEIKEQVKNSGYGDPETITNLMAARYVVRSKITGKDEYTLWTEDNIQINRVSDESQIKESPEERKFRQENDPPEDNPLGFYSELSRFVESAPFKKPQTKKQWKDLLNSKIQKGELKKSEVDYYTNELLEVDDGEKVTKEDFLSFIEQKQAETELVEFRRGENLEGLEEVEAGEGWEHNLDYFADGDDFNYDNDYSDDELEKTVEKLAEDEDNFDIYIEDVEQRLMEDGDVGVDEIYMGKYETYQDYDAIYEIEFEKILSEQIEEETKGKELTEDDRDQIEADLRDSLESDDFLVRDSILDGIKRGKYSIDIDPRTNPRADQYVESLARELLKEDGDWRIYEYIIESGDMESGDTEIDYVVRGNDNIGWEVRGNYGEYEGSYDSIEEITESFREYYDDLKKEQAPDFDMEDSDDRIFYTGEMKFGDMQRARLGETNKREFLLSMPSFDTQFNAHWDEPNVVVHSRGGDLAHPILGKTLHIDEIQADPAKKRFQGRFKNPYLKSEDWALLAFKRLLKIAIDEGHDTITWANGLNVLDRNSSQLRELVDEVEWEPFKTPANFDLSAEEAGIKNKIVTLYKNKNQKYKFTIDQTGKIISSSVNNAIGKPFTEIIPNKKIVNEILASEKGKIGQDKIQVGGKGYTGLYNDILPKVVEKYLKKFDKTIKVEQATHGLVKNDKKDQLIQEEVFAVRLTDKLRNEILTKGQPLFQDKRGQIRIGDNYYYIDLFKNADFTTLLHEFGHSWLDMIRKDYDYVTSLEGELTPIQKRFIKDAEALMKEFGVESLADVTVENHELFARWTEAYMMEGKSPSPELKSVFHRFKAYLLSIYKKLENLNAPLTDEVRGIFDRLISLDAHKDAQDFAPLFNENTVVGMTPSDAEKYMVAMGEAEEDAEKEMLNQAMADHRRKQDKAYKKELKETTNEVIEELKNEGIHRVIEFLKETPISKESLQEVVPENELQDYKKYYTNKPEGLALGIVADMFGYPTGAELIEAIKSAPDINELADFLAKQRLESQEDASLASDEQLESIARKAIHNDGRAKLLQLEMELLRKNNPSVFNKALEAAIARTPKLKEVKEQAQKIIDNKKIKEIKPYKYYNAERAAAKAAGKAFRKGDFQEAFNQKRNELLNHELYRAAVKAKDTETKIKKDFKKLNKPDKKLAKNRDINFINAARAILDPYDMLPKSIKPMDSLGLLKRYDPDAYDAIKALIDSATFDKTDLKELTFAELQQIADTIKALWDMSKQSMSMDIDGKEKSKAEIKQELMDQIDELNLPKHEIGYKKAATTWEKAKIGLMGMRSALRRVESWVDAMDIKWGGPFRKYIWNPVSEAAEIFRTKKNDYSVKFKNIMEKYKDNITFKPILAGELGYTFKDKAELLGAMLHTGNGSNKKKLLAGRGWGDIREDGTLNSQKWDGFIDRMIKQGVLNKKDFDMLQEIWDLFEELKPDAQKAHKRLYGFFFNEITADPIETPFGKYRGGYAPALTDSILVEDQKIREDKEIFESEGNAFMFPQTSKGFTISRIESYTAPLVMDLRLFPQHLDKVLRFTYIQPVVSDVASLVNDKEFRDKLHKIDPTIASEMLIPWLQRSVQQRVETPAKGRGWQAVSSIAKALRTNTGLNIMFGNLTNTLQQFTGISIAAVKVKKRLLRDALWEVTRNSKKVTESINDKSQFMKNRNATQLMDVNKRVNEIILNPTKYDKAREWAREHGYFMQQFTQGIVDNIVWLGAYNQAVEEGMSEKDAVRFADSTVRETQGSFDPEAVSEFETGTAFRRFFTMFYSYFNMQANLLGSEFAKIQRERGLRKGLGRGLYVYTMGFMAPAFLSELIVQAMGGAFDEDDDDNYMDDFMVYFFGSQLRTATAMVPFVGPTIQAGINSWNDKWYDDRISTSPAISVLESSVKVPLKVYNAIAEGKNKRGAVKDTLTAVGLATGVPVAPLGRPLGYLIDVEEGKAKPSGVADFMRGLVTGKAGNK